MRLIQMKQIKGLFWAREWSSLKMDPMGIEAGILLTHQLMDPLCKELC
jgi:hypothetical protein